MRSPARFIVDTHAHITTLYQPKGTKGMQLPEKVKEWTVNEVMGKVVVEMESFDNSPLCLYDMERYGIDMCLLKPSVIGTTNESQAALVEKYPDKFRAFCSAGQLNIKVARGEAKWTLDDAADEVEKALKTGKFIGIGEMVPGQRRPGQSFEERLNEYRSFAELAKKYGVSIDFHDFDRHFFDCYELIAQLALEFPDVPIIFCHAGYSIGSYTKGSELIRKACGVAQYVNNVYLETGNWPAEYFKYALKNPNVGPTQLIWGGDYGNVPQYIMQNPLGDPPTFASVMKRFPPTPYYHIDWWGWALHQIDRVRDWATADEINLILGGNAAKIWRLPVPHERMFLCGRPDVFGINWEESVPYIPRKQVLYPDYED